METLKALNKKQIKELLKSIEGHYEIKELKLDYIFYQSNKGKIFLLSNKFKDFDHSNLNINSLGLYFANIKDKEVRLSVEGSQLIGNKAKKNAVEINEEELKDWLLGEDLEKKKGESFVLIKNKNDFYGSGKITKDSLLNFVPKEKRMNVI